MATTFTDAVSRAPMRAFQWITVTVCMLVLVCDGIDLQLLGIVAPLVIEDFAVSRGTFGWAMSAALVGFGLGAWGGGWLGDTIGRRWTLALAALVFSLATMGASLADGVGTMALWRLLGGLGFGAAYANALAMASEWLPDRWRAVTISTLSVGTPLGGTVVGLLAPDLAEIYGWKGTFVVFGAATMIMVVVILVALRDSPSFLMARGKPEQARRAARKVLDADIELVAERHDTDSSDGSSVGVLHSGNFRLNLGIGIAFAACALVAYGILSWSTTFLTASGFTLDQAGTAVSVGGITAMMGSVAAGMLARHFGSRRVMLAISGTLLIIMLALGYVVETLPAVPTVGERWIVVALIAAAAAVFSAGIAAMYVMMAYGYPQSCRSAGIGFGIFMSRVGAISATLLGGALLDWGDGSVVPFFGALAASALLVSAAAFIVDRHVPPTKAAG